MKPAWLTMLVFIFNNACSATPAQQQPAERGPVSASDCVHQSSISSFRTLDDRHVVLYEAGGRNAYVAEIAPGCFDIPHAAEIGAIDGDGNGRICGYGRDQISYRAFGRPESCRIMSLQRR